MYNKFQESHMGWQKGAMNARQVSRKSPGMAKRGDECTTSFTKVSWDGCDKKCKKSVFLSLYKFCYNSVHFCICQNLINSSVEIIIFIMSTELFAQISRVNPTARWTTR